MKSREEISRRLEALKKTRPQNDTDILYLEAVLMHDMTYLKNLWCKYTLEV